MTSEDCWAIVLAGGDGTRLRQQQATGDGQHVPKQFRVFYGTESLLRSTIRRAEALFPATRIVTVVAEQHRGWWQDQLAELPRENIVVQPENKGTGPGILLPVLHVLERNPDARIVVFPSDHYVEREALLYEALYEALGLVSIHGDRIVLLGTHPSDGEADYGWMVPLGSKGVGAAKRVAQFYEKPDMASLKLLKRQGAIVNSLILVARARAVVRAFEEAVPGLAHVFAGARSESGSTKVDLRSLYSRLGRHDFSREVLERVPDRLLVYPISEVCGWTDLGTPSRLTRFLSGHSGDGSLQMPIVHHQNQPAGDTLPAL